jgi:hypothetical protein
MHGMVGTLPAVVTTLADQCVSAAERRQALLELNERKEEA